MNNLDEKIVSKMKNKALEFNDFQNSYYRDEKNDEDATSMTTQPFWQSMKLSKRRMQEKGIVIQNDISENERNRITKKASYSDGKNQVGEFKRNLKIHRNIYKDGKKIYSEKDHNICNISLVKVEGDGEEAVCPKCGNKGKISTYIDGCDYCGTKFQVNDFDEKISAYYFEENTGTKTTNAFAKSFGTSAVFTMLGNLLLLVAIFVLIFLDITDTSLKAETLVGVAFLWIAFSIPVSSKIAIATLIVFAVIGIFLIRKSKSMVEKSDMVEAVIPSFNKTDFVQNLEYKLRNIHMTDSVKEVDFFANCDLSEAVAGYSDVVDCYITKLRFTDVRADADKYYVEFNVVMRLTKLKGKRIKFENEKLKLTMSLLKGISDVNIGSIRQYLCANCGSSVSLLNGGVCEYCGTNLDYARHSFIIENYLIVGKCMDRYKSIKLMLMAVYATVFVVMVSTVVINNSYDIYLLLNIKDAMEYAHDCYDKVETLDNIDSTVSLEKYDRGYVDREYRYNCENKENSMITYGEYLVENGYMRYTDEFASVCYVKEYRMDEVLTGHHIVEMSFDGNKLVIEHFIIESDDLNEEYWRVD